MRKRDLLLSIVLLCIAFFILTYYDRPADRVIRYDCTMAEMHPDYPVEVKEACRKLRAERKNHD